MKRCTVCGIAKALTEFSPLKSGTFGVRAQCKQCRSPDPAAYRSLAERAKPLTEKKCNRCEETKPASEFSMLRKTGKLLSKCKVCSNELGQEWAKADPENARAIRKASYDRNRAKRNAAGRKHYAENKAYYAAKNVQWVRDNAAANRARRARYRARKLNAPGSHTLEEWQAVLEKYGRCLRCGVTGVHLEPDHVIPLSKGGRDSIENLQPLCRSCNSGKGDTAADYRDDLYDDEEDSLSP